MAYTISEFVCPQTYCCPLIKVCPVGAISQDGHALPVIDQEKCTECGLCKISCPLKAVKN